MESIQTQLPSKYKYYTEYNGMICRFYPIIVTLYNDHNEKDILKKTPVIESMPYDNLPQYVNGKVHIGYSGYYPLYKYVTLNKLNIKVLL
jgi:hypothetical protein